MCCPLELKKEELHKSLKPTIPQRLNATRLKKFNTTELYWKNKKLVCQEFSHNICVAGICAQWNSKSRRTRKLFIFVKAIKMSRKKNQHLPPSKWTCKKTSSEKLTGGPATLLTQTHTNHNSIFLGKDNYFILFFIFWRPPSKIAATCIWLICNFVPGAKKRTHTRSSAGLQFFYHVARQGSLQS